MALTGERDYQSSVMWFLDRSSAGNAPGTLNQAKAEELTSFAMAFAGAYLQALASTSNDTQKIQDTSDLCKSVAKYVNEATIDNLIKIVQKVGSTIDDVFVMKGGNGYELVSAALKSLMIEFIDIADTLRNDSLTKAVLAISKPYSDRLKEIAAENMNSVS